MFIGRQAELKRLEELCCSDSFEFLVMYGRRRVGKTSLLKEYAGKHKTIFFSAQEKNDSLNLVDFSRAVQTSHTGDDFGVFRDWEAAFQYVGDHTGSERVTLIIDEFPFIAQENPTVKSILQHIIDHQWSQKKILLILCGSSVSFMVNEVMGYKSPLYGRSTTQMEVEPFDYLDSAAFFPGYSHIDQLLAYGILGGIPCYLQRFSDKRTIAENIQQEILRTGSFLKDEPQLLLKMELREPAVYNSIFEAIAGGASRMNDIAQKIKEDSGKCSRYMATLKEIRLLDRITPCGEDETTKRTVYQITDNFYTFWYRYIFANRSYYELLGEEDAAQEITSDLSNLMGAVFERVCQQYMVRMAKARKLPFVPFKMGKWWGNNPVKRRQDDIDILALDRTGSRAIFCECKFRNELFDMQEYRVFMDACAIFTQVKEPHYYLFVKSGYTKDVQKQAAVDGVKLLMIDDLFSIEQ